MHIHHENRGILLMLLSTVAAAAMMLLGDYVFRTYPTLTYEHVAMWGNIGGWLMFAFFFGSTNNRRLRVRKCIQVNGGALLGASAATSVGALLFWYALKSGGSGPMAVLGKSEVLFSLFLGIALLGERPRVFDWIGMTIAIIGFVLFSRLDGTVPAAIVIAILLSRACYALQSFIVKKYTCDLDASAFAFVRFGILTIAWMLYTICTVGFAFIPLWATVLISTALILNAVFSKMLFFEAHKYLPISKLNFFILLQPIYILLGGMFFFGDHVSATDWIGTMLVIVGLSSLSFKSGPK